MILFKATKKSLCLGLLALNIGCASLDIQPFEEFHASLEELDRGVVSTLDVTIPLAEARYRKELTEDLAQGNTELLRQLFISPDTKDPFYISEPPSFVKANNFKLGIAKTNLAWLQYTGLLVKLSAQELADEEEFADLSVQLNNNAFYALQALDGELSESSYKDIALFSELSMVLAREYVKTSQKKKLVEAINSNQSSIAGYVKKMQAAIVTMAQFSTQEYSEKQADLSRKLIGLAGEGGSIEVDSVAGEMIAVKREHAEQMLLLQNLHAVYGKIPEAHAALAKRLVKPEASLAAITDLLERGTLLYAAYDVKAKVNKTGLVQAKADAASSQAAAAELRSRQARLKASQAQFEYTLAQNVANEDPENATKKKDAENKKKIAEELRLNADKLEIAALELRASALALQESANEVQNSILEQ